MKHENGYWIDDSNNRWSDENFSEENARRLSSQLVNCIDCVDCKWCINCKGCVNCFECRGCENCVNCSNCGNCSNCVKCVKCVDCSDCKELTFSLNATGRSMWRIPVEWTMYGSVPVEANSLEEALAFAINNKDVLQIPQEGEYMNDTFAITITEADDPAILKLNGLDNNKNK